MKKKTLCFLTAAVMLLFAAGCGRPVGGGIDPNKTQIYISVFAGGFGTQWMENFRTEYNKTQDKYEFIRRPDKKEYIDTTTSKIKSGIIEADIFIIDTSDIRELIAGDYLQDLSNVWAAVPEGESKSIADKLLHKELYSAAVSKGEGKYALPYAMGLSGIIYDHDLLVTANALLPDSTTANGLTKGVDGVEGTDDDGLPATIEEFRTLLSRIKQRSLVPLIYSDNTAVGLTEPIAEAVWAKYDGIKNYEMSFDYDGEYVSPSTGAKTIIKPEEGYKMYTQGLQEGRVKAAEFLKEFLTNKDYLAQEDGLSHTDAQGKFILSHNTGSPIAMIADGYWWENESRRYFLEDNQDADYAYGKRDFRFLPIPAYSDSTMSGNRNVMAVNTYGTVFAVKQQDAGKSKAVEDFLTAYASDNHLQQFTVTTGAMLPYNYELTDTQKSQMTKFARNTYNMLMRPNMEIVIPDLLETTSIFVDAVHPDKSDFKLMNRWSAEISRTVQRNLYNAMNAASTAQAYSNSLKTSFTADSWARMYAAL